MGNFAGCGAKKGASPPAPCSALAKLLIIIIDFDFG
jgi:hypothetical protein